MYTNGGARNWGLERKGAEIEGEEVVHRALQQQKASVSSGVITEADQNFN